MIPHNKITYDGTELERIIDVVRSGNWGEGCNVKELETTVAKFVGVSGAVAVGSGVGALRLALHALGVAEGNHVLIPSYCCVALANSVMSLGAIPVPVDCDENYCMDVEQALDVSRKTSARVAITVNTFGIPSRAYELERHGIRVIEDSSHGMPWDYVHKKPERPLTTVTILSLYATKFVGAGEGGIAISDSYEVVERIRYNHDYSGKEPSGIRLNDKMNELEAALALAQMSRINDVVLKRRGLAERYISGLKKCRDIDGIVDLPEHVDGRVWYRFPIRLYMHDALEIREKLNGVGVKTGIPVWPWVTDDVLAQHANARHAFQQTLSLPLYPTLSSEEQDIVMAGLLDALNAY